MAKGGESMMVNIQDSGYPGGYFTNMPSISLKPWELVCMPWARLDEPFPLSVDDQLIGIVPREHALLVITRRRAP